MNQIIFIVLLAQCVRSEHNFLKHIKKSSLLDLSNDKMNYYISQQIHLNWIDAYTFCRLSGLHLAKFSRNDFLVSITNNWMNEFSNVKDSILFDGSNFNREASTCSVIHSHSKMYNSVSVQNVSCTDGIHRFACEHPKEFEEDDESTSYQDERSLRLIKHLGDYADPRSSETLKKYYISESGLELSATDAANVCHSFGMKLASPQNQNEYNNLRELLSKLPFHRRSQVFIEAYRSKKSAEDWLSAGNKVKYKISFAENQPDNNRNKENCLVFSGSTVSRLPSMNDVHCDLRGQFICEREKLVRTKRSLHSDEKFKFVNVIASFGYTKSNESILKIVYASHKFLKVSWIQARNICKSFGMDLMVFETEFEDRIRKELETNDAVPKHFHVGASSIGADYWFSTATGEPLNFNIRWKRGDKIDSSKLCLMMEIQNGLLVYTRVNCALVATNFMCQNVITNNLRLKSEKLSESFSTDKEDETSFYSFWFNAQSIPLESPNDERDVIIKPDYSVCSTEQDFYDSNGNYVKTACQASYESSRENACVDRGMQLFKIESLETHEKLLQLATSIFGRHGGSMLWIDGKKEEDGKWYTSNPKMLLIDGIVDKKRNLSASNSEDSIDFLPTYYENGENCLILSAFLSFQVTKWSCSSKMFSFCEFIKPEITLKPAELIKISTSSANKLSKPQPLSNLNSFRYKHENEVTEDSNNDDYQNDSDDMKKTNSTHAETNSVNWLRLDECDETIDLSVRRKLKKVLCLVKQNLTHGEARKLCDDNGMSLHVSSFHNYERAVGVILLDYHNAIVWAEGKNVEVKRANAKLFYVQKCNIIEKIGNVLYISESADCFNKYWAVCQYIKFV